MSYKSIYFVVIVMKELTPLTTNAQGIEEFIVDTKLAYKSVMLKDFSIYLDYSEKYELRTFGNTTDDVVRNLIMNMAIELNKS